MGAALADLSPSIELPNEHGFQYLRFLCPVCRKHVDLIGIWARPSGEVKWTAEYGPASQRVWQATQGPNRDWATLSITPSIDIAPHNECAGWHGFITNGEAKP